MPALLLHPQPHSTRCWRIFLIVANVTVLGIGTVMTGIGAGMRDIAPFDSNEQNQNIANVCNVVLAAGVFSCVAGIVGACGGCLETLWILWLHIGSVLLGLVLQVISSILLYRLRSTARRRLQTVLGQRSVAMCGETPCAQVTDVWMYRLTTPAFAVTIVAVVLELIMVYAAYKLIQRIRLKPSPTSPSSRIASINVLSANTSFKRKSAHLSHTYCEDLRPVDNVMEVPPSPNLMLDDQDNLTKGSPGCTPRRNSTIRNVDLVVVNEAYNSETIVDNSPELNKKKVSFVIPDAVVDTVSIETVAEKTAVKCRNEPERSDSLSALSDILQKLSDSDRRHDTPRSSVTSFNPPPPPPPTPAKISEPPSPSTSEASNHAVVSSVSIQCFTSPVNVPAVVFDLDSSSEITPTPSTQDLTEIPSIFVTCVDSSRHSGSDSSPGDHKTSFTDEYSTPIEDSPDDNHEGFNDDVSTPDCIDNQSNKVSRNYPTSLEN